MIRLQAERAHRRAIRKAVDVKHPGKRGQDAVVGLVVAVLPALSERRYRTQGQRWIERVQDVPSKAHPRHRARLEAFDDDVGALCKPTQDRGALGMFKVERQRALVEVVEPKEQAAVALRTLVDEWTDAPCGVTSRRLHLDHVGAHVGQQTGAKMALQVGEIEDAQVGQRAALAHLFTLADVWPSPSISRATPR